MALPTPTVLRRALLYVPSSSPKMLAKSLSITADNITYDLEDSVTPSQKPQARAALAAHLSSLSSASSSSSSSSSGPRHSARELAVRINAATTPSAQADLVAVAPFLALPGRPRAGRPVSALVVPKVASAADLRAVADAARHLAAKCCPPAADDDDSPTQPLHLIALIESARAVTDLREICAALESSSSSPSPDVVLSALVFAAEDFAADVGLRRSGSLREFAYARAAVVTHAAAFALPGGALDLVCTSFQGEAGLARLREECEDGRGLGFRGKQCIHPAQVAVVQEVFGVGEEDLREGGEVDWAVRVVVADAKAAEMGRGAWTLRGKMVDAPVVERARRVLAKAELCGVDLAELRERWKDQEPE